MNRTADVLLTGIATGFGFWWYRTLQRRAVASGAERGRLIYSNAPLIGRQREDSLW